MGNNYQTLLSFAITIHPIIITRCSLLYVYCLLYPLYVMLQQNFGCKVIIYLYGEIPLDGLTSEMYFFKT